jgi:hypothetical protein
MNVIVHLIICGLLVLALVAVFLYRKFIDDHDDHNIHLGASAIDLRVINTQVQHTKRIEALSRLTKYLTIAVILYLIAIACIAGYSAWTGAGL